MRNYINNLISTIFSSTQDNRLHMSVYMDEDCARRLTDLAARLGAPSELDIINRALSLYEGIAAGYQPGDEVTVFVGYAVELPAQEAFKFSAGPEGVELKLVCTDEKVND
jgi:hypothetical protein